VADNAEEPEVFIRHLLICEVVHHDPFRPDRSYSLERIVNWLCPEDEYGYPLVVEKLMLFAQVWGDRKDFELRIDLVRLDSDDDSGQLIQRFENRHLTVHGNEFVETKRWILHQVSFPEPRVYEFRLIIPDSTESLASERILLQEGYR
jgi:hypothetical protein